ncbi:MAG: class I SAM-dependent methyltransferase [Bryobacteraceae bacterium]|jgi:predicted O-methyltransferase YrrM
MLQRFAAAVRQRQERAHAAALARQLDAAADYSFTADYLSPHVGEWTELLAVYQGRPDVRMLEIGSFEGRSTLWFLANILTHPTAGIVCVDVFAPASRELRFDHNLRIAAVVDKVKKLKGRSEDLLAQLPRDSFDIIYVDGSHQAVNVLYDAVSAWFLLKAGGVLIFDDYQWEVDKPPSERPQPAIDLFLTAFEGRYELLSKAYQVILRKRAPNSNP